MDRCAAGVCFLFPYFSKCVDAFSCTCNGGGQHVWWQNFSHSQYFPTKFSGGLKHTNIHRFPGYFWVMITRGLLGPFLAGTQVSNPVRSAQRRFCLGRFIWFSRCTGGGFFGCLKLIFRAIHTHIEALQRSVGPKNAPILTRKNVSTHFKSCTFAQNAWTPTGKVTSSSWALWFYLPSPFLHSRGLRSFARVR